MSWIFTRWIFFKKLCCVYKNSNSQPKMIKFLVFTSMNRCVCVPPVHWLKTRMICLISVLKDWFIWGFMWGYLIIRLNWELKDNLSLFKTTLLKRDVRAERERALDWLTRRLPLSLVTTHVSLARSGSSLLTFLLYLMEQSSCQWKEQGFRCGGRGAGPLPSHWCPSKDKYWLWTVLITSLNWAILLFPVGLLWKIHAGIQWEAAEQSRAWRAINHRRYIIHWKHVKRTRQDGSDHWKEHFHRSAGEEEPWRCVRPLRHFCYSRLTKLHTSIYWFVIFCTTQKCNVGRLFLAPRGSQPVTQKSLTCQEHYYSVIQ